MTDDLVKRLVEVVVFLRVNDCDRMAERVEEAARRLSSEGDGK